MTVANLATAVGWQPGTAGIHAGDDGETVGQLLDRLLTPLSIAWVVTPSGSFEFRRWTFTGPVETLAADTITRETVFDPLKKRIVGYRRNYRIHTDGEISAAVLAGDVVFDDGSILTDQFTDLNTFVGELATDLDAKRTVFIRTTAPTLAESAEGDWWMQTNASGAVIATYERVAGTGRLAIGTSTITIGGNYIAMPWSVVTDKRITDAISAATAASDLADTKAVVFTMFYSSDPVPTGTDYGDVLVRAYLNPVQMDYWNGSAWIPAATYGATAAQIATLTDALSTAENAEAIADGKVDTFYQTSPPSGSIGDLWFDTDDANKLYRHDGSGWVLARDTGVATAISAAAGAQATADGKVTTYSTETTPSSPSLGDLWYKPSTGLIQRWNGAAWANAASLGAPSGTNVGGTSATTVESGANAANNGVNSDGTIKTDKVATAAVQNSAITAIVGAYTAASIGFAAATWTQIQTITINCTGGAVFVQASCFMHQQRTGTIPNNQMRITRDGTVVYGPILLPSTYVPAAGGGASGCFFDGPISFAGIDAPASGNRTYNLELYRDVGTLDMANRSLTVTEFKR